MNRQSKILHCTSKIVHDCTHQPLMSTKEKYKKIKAQIVMKLGQGLSKTLYYHSLHHTLDILKQAERIAKEENINNEEDLFLLKVACLYHDSGFLTTYKGH